MKNQMWARKSECQVFAESIDKPGLCHLETTEHGEEFNDDWSSAITEVKGRIAT
jgi:hypothetical protein